MGMIVYVMIAATGIYLFLKPNVATQMTPQEYRAYFKRKIMGMK